MDPALYASLGTLATVIISVASLWLKVNRTVGSNGGSTLHDGMKEVKQDIRVIRETQVEQGQRIAKLEERTSK